MSDRAQEILEPNIVNGDLDDDVVAITTAGLIGDIEDALVAAGAALLRAEAAEAKLREAVEVMRDIATSDDIDNCLDPERNKRVARAFLATMEKPRD